MFKPHRLWFNSISLQGIERNNNEDYLFIRNHSKEKFAIFGVSDGMGGLEDGEVASRIVCNSFDKAVINNAKHELNERAILANSAIFSEQTKRGATAAIAIIDKETLKFYGISIGDSRIYKYSNLKTTQLTIDDIPRYNNSDKMRNYLTEALGLRYQIHNLKIISGHISKNESLLLTTDGIHSFLTEQDIQESMQLFSKTQILAELTEQALNRGSNDDMTAIFVTLGN
ncbi:MAG TPA: hypothetical protein DCS48_01325 [Desulfovibrio sp.]|nr:hypothetical protein [Desulfovibrio sp.]